MSFEKYNPNPRRIETEDCVVRAICKATGREWEDVYMSLMVLGFREGMMPSTNKLWAKYLHQEGFKRTHLPDTCPACYTVAEFAAEHPAETYLLATGTHLVAVVDGKYYDTWDSGAQVPLSVWRKE